MFSYSWSAYVPYEADGGSIDPLKSQSTSIRIGEILFPGTSGRTWRVRYLSELCYVISLAQTSPDQTFKENYKKVRPYENILLVLHRQLANKGDKDTRGRVIGTAKVGGIVEKNKYVNLGEDLLATQVALGPLGVHLVSLTAFGLVHPENLTLTTRGEDLVEAYRQTIGSADAMIKELPTNRLNLEKLGDVPESLSFAYLEKKNCNERKILREILVESRDRAALIKDLKLLSHKISDDVVTDYAVLSQLVELGSPQLIKYQLASQFDELNRALRYSFDCLLRVPLNKLRYRLQDELGQRIDFKIVQPAISRSLEALSKTAEQHQKLFEDPRDAVGQVFDLIDDVSKANSSADDLAQHLIRHHTDHQASKGKAPWVDFVDDTVVEVAHRQLLNPDERPGFQEFNSNALHRYRVCNAFIMLKDLDLGGAA